MLGKIAKTLISLALAAAMLCTTFFLGVISGKRSVREEMQASLAQQTLTQPAATEWTVPAVVAATLPQKQTVSTQPEETEPPEQRYILTFVGDCTFGGNPSNYYAGAGFVKTVGEDYAYPFANVISYFEEDDFTFANLEGTLCDEGVPQPRKHNFRGPTAFVNILTQNSVECVTLANNHTMDYGEAGYASTIKTLTDAGVPFVEKNSSTIVTLEGGLTIGIYASTYDSEDPEDMVAQITAMKEQNVDVIIYAAHWGGENNYHTNPPQEKLGHMAIDVGAHIVYGSHPHVLQPIEEYNGGVIYYSLANFSFGGNGGPKDMDTAILQQEVIQEADGTVHLGKLTAVPCSVSSSIYVNNYQPTPYAPDSVGYARVLRKLNGTY